MVCPACSAAYDVPESLLTPGRVVRCARCGNEWVPVAGPPPPSPEAAPEPQWPEAEEPEDAQTEPPGPPPADIPRFTAMDRLALHRPSTRDSRIPLRVAWVATILALLTLFAVAYVWRVELMHAWPASQRLYDALGLGQHMPAPGAP